MLNRSDIVFKTTKDGEGDVLIVEITIPQGTLLIMAEFEIADRTIIARGLHIDGIGVNPNDLGSSVLRQIIQKALEETDHDELIVEGSRRTTGASPGRVPKPLRFKRASGSSCRGE